MNCVEYALALRSVTNDFKADVDAAIPELSDRRQRVLHSLAPDQRASRDHDESAAGFQSRFEWTEYLGVHCRANHNGFLPWQAKVLRLFEDRLGHTVHRLRLLKGPLQTGGMETVFEHVRIDVYLAAPATDDHRGGIIEERPISDGAVDPWEVNDIPTPAGEREQPVEVLGTVAHATELA